MADTSNPYDNLLNLAPSNDTTPGIGGTPSVNPYDDIVGQQNRLQEEQLNLVLREAATIDPVNQAEVQRISRETGIPQDLVGRNQEEILREWGARRARTAEIARNNPIVAQQLSDREFASIAWDDIPNLTNTEALVNFFRELPEDAAAGYRRGVNTNEMGYIGHRAQIGTATEEDMTRFRELQEIDRETGRLGFIGNTTTILADARQPGRSCYHRCLHWPGVRWCCSDCWSVRPAGCRPRRNCHRASWFRNRFLRWLHGQEHRAGIPYRSWPFLHGHD